MERHSSSKSSLFLLEMIISIFFMALTSVVCVRLFLYAHDLSARSTKMSTSASLMQNAAEAITIADGDIVTARSILDDLGRDDLSMSCSITEVSRKKTDSGIIYEVLVQIIDEKGDVSEEQIIRHYAANE